MDDPNCDGVLVILTPQAMTDPTGGACADRCGGSHQLKPVLTSFMGEIKVADRAPAAMRAIPDFPDPERRGRGRRHLHDMYQYTRNLGNLYETPADILPEFEPDRDAVDDLPGRARDGRSILSEPEAKAVLEAYQGPDMQDIRRQDG